MKSILGRVRTLLSSCSESFSADTVLSARSTLATALMESLELRLLLDILMGRFSAVADLLMRAVSRLEHPFIHERPRTFAMLLSCSCTCKQQLQRRFQQGF